MPDSCSSCGELIAPAARITSREASYTVAIPRDSASIPTALLPSKTIRRVNVRVGPGQNYKVKWVFTKPGLPLEVIVVAVSVPMILLVWPM